MEYTSEEVGVWGTALSNLKALYPKHACRQFNEALDKLNFRQVLTFVVQGCALIAAHVTGQQL